MLSCISSFHHHVSLSPFWFPKCHSQYSFSCFSQYFRCFVPLIRQPILASQNPGYLLSKRFLTPYLLQFPPSYLWLYSAFFFFTMRAILHSTIRCCFGRTYSPLPYNRTFPSSFSFCTSYNLLGYFFRHFYKSPCVLFLLEISADNRQIHLLGKIHNIDSSLYLVPAPYLSVISSSPIFPSPTCPLRSAPRTILPCFDTLSINPSRSCQKLFFFFMLLLTCGAHALTMFSIDSFTSNFMAISLSDTLFTFKTLSTSSSLTTIPISFSVPSVPL